MPDQVPFPIFALAWTVSIALIAVIWRSNEKRVSTLEKRVEAHDKLDAAISAIQTDIKWIRDSVNDIKACRINH